MKPILEFSCFLNLCLYRYFCKVTRILSLETPKQVFRSIAVQEKVNHTPAWISWCCGVAGMRIIVQRVVRKENRIQKFRRAGSCSFSLGSNVLRMGRDGLSGALTFEGIVGRLNILTGSLPRSYCHGARSQEVSCFGCRSCCCVQHQGAVKLCAWTSACRPCVRPCFACRTPVHAAPRSGFWPSHVPLACCQHVFFRQVAVECLSPPWFSAHA